MTDETTEITDWIYEIEDDVRHLKETYATTDDLNVLMLDTNIHFEE